jgi:hypothetical protein
LFDSILTLELSCWRVEQRSLVFVLQKFNSAGHS